MSTPPPTAAPATKAERPRAAGARRGADSPAASRRIAGLHRQGNTYRIVVARVESPASAATVVESRSVPAGDTAALVAALAAQKADLLVRVVPSSQTIARCVPLPGANTNGSSNGVEQDRTQLASALSLLAEAELPAMLPAHRRAAGVIRPGPEGPDPRSKKAEAALLTGWPARADEPPPKSGVKDESFATEIAALALLARAVGGAPLALYADRETGAVAMLASGVDDKGAPKVAARVLRADTSSAGAWKTSIESSGAELAASVGIGSFDLAVPDAPTSLLIEAPSPKRPPGAPADPAWMGQFGIAYGAVIAAAQSDPAVRSLAGLSERSKGDHAGPLERTLSWMAVPRNGGLVIAACLLMWLFWPLAIAAARHWALGRNTGGASALQDRLSDAQRRAAFYETLKQRRWPMTKLIADVAGAAPVGITIDTLDLTRDQGLSIRGKADRDTLVTTFRKNLTDSSVFTGVATPNIETEASGVSFQLDALIAAPLFPARRADDFRTNTLAVRLYGERAAKSGTASSSGADSAAAPPSSGGAPAKPDSPAADTARRPRTGRSARDDTPAKPEESGARHPASTATGPPAPISDAEIAKLDKAGAMKEWTTRKSASSKPDLDPAVKQRLTDEATKAKARFDEVKNQGGGS